MVDVRKPFIVVSDHIWLKPAWSGYKDQLKYYKKHQNNDIITDLSKEPKGSREKQSATTWQKKNNESQSIGSVFFNRMIAKLESSISSFITVGWTTDYVTSRGVA